MHPLLPATIVVAWLIALFFGWAFVHGAQLLRRQEVAALITAQPRGSEQTGTIASIAPEPTQLPHAA